MKTQVRNAVLDGGLATRLLWLVVAGVLTSCTTFTDTDFVSEFDVDVAEDVTIDASSDSGDGTLSDASVNDVVTLNPCGGVGELRFQGNARGPGEPCGACGVLVCDGADNLQCVGDTGANSCGGCEPLAGAPADACGFCGAGMLACDEGDDVLTCEGAVGVNACDGCGDLEFPIGDVCDIDGIAGVTTCRDGRSICVAPGANSCGGLSELDNSPGEPCGVCGAGRWGCEGPDELVCDDSRAVTNECGGCAPLANEVGEPCGTCGGAWQCAGDAANRLICSDPGRNRCGGCEDLGGRPGDECDAGGIAGELVCQGVNELVCVPEERNECGGSAELVGEPGLPCGECGDGYTVCAGIDELVCIGASRPNACAGCGLLPGTPGDTCAVDHEWRCTDAGELVCARVQDSVVIGDPTSSGTVTIELPGLSLEIPVDALPLPTGITVRLADFQEVEGFLLTSPVFEFLPGGTTFDPPLLLRIVSSEPEASSIYWTESPDGEWARREDSTVVGEFIESEVGSFSFGFAGYPLVPIEICGNGIDDDGNGRVDCDDSACLEKPECIDEVCDNELDDDGDGATDCADSECEGVSPCGTELCGDGIDNDGDGSTDCDDEECDLFAACLELVCNDGLDNDGDGDADCADDDCSVQSYCSPVETCADDFDNDGDGEVDCDDLDCLADSECIEEVCDDGEDNDVDGASDCADSECALFEACGDEICTDVFDNDGDGDTDCDDADCSADPACIDELCLNGSDDDGDGLADCLDPECEGEPSCGPEVCDDAFDNDGDGDMDCDDDECIGSPTCIPEADACDDDFDNDVDGFTDCLDADCSADDDCVVELCGNGVDDDSDGFEDCADDECFGDRVCDPTLDENYVVVPAGTFMMGAPIEEGDSRTDETPYRVTLTHSFEMQVTEVTQGQWDALLVDNASEFPACGDACPANLMTLYGAMAYANALSVSAELEPCYSLETCTGSAGANLVCEGFSINSPGQSPYECEGYRLPTEAEWEYAARGGTTGMSHAGDFGPGTGCESTVLETIGWFCGNADVSYAGCVETSDPDGFGTSCGGIHPVGELDANPFGLYDMHGNVFERTSSLRGDYPTGAVIDPAGAVQADGYTIRGGSFFYPKERARAARRDGAGDTGRQRSTGFRVVRTLTAEVCENGSDDTGNGLVDCDDPGCVTDVACAGAAPDGMALIPAGNFLMGSPADELGRTDDEIPHEVYITRPFYLSTLEYSEADYVAATGLTYYARGCDAGNATEVGCPVINSDWTTGLHLANLRSVDEGLEPCYDLSQCWSYPGYRYECDEIRINTASGSPVECEGYRLPTEAEWEYAARAGSGASTYGGELTTVDCSDTTLTPIAWFCGNQESAASVHASGRLAANAFGLYDMLGNESEWVWDIAGPLGTDSVSDPLGAGSGEFRVIRGGDTTNEASSLRAASRVLDREPQFQNAGFRLARTALVEVCGNGVDDDFDGDTDCDDSACAARYACDPLAEDGWVALSPATFAMGSPPGELGRGSSETQHDVTITRPFEIQVVETTWAHWDSIMSDTFLREADCGQECPTHPDWFDSLAYANALSAEAGYEECYDLSECRFLVGFDFECDSVGINAPGGNLLDCEGYRLPTEAEWEYAARGGTTTATYNGDITVIGAEDTTLPPIAWFRGNAEDVHRVALLRPNDYGLYDMLGNVTEWAWDWHAPFSADAVVDPLGPETGTVRTARGGAFDRDSDECRAASRSTDLELGMGSVTAGVRLVRTLPSEVCDNLLDDDGDGLYDCADPDCEGVSPTCDPADPSSFVRVPAGTYEFGRYVSNRQSLDDVVTPVNVTLTNDFFVQVTEVTRGQWFEYFVQAPATTGECGDDCPVGNLMFPEALAYANARSLDEGLAPCYDLSACSGTPGNRSDVFTCASLAMAPPASSPYECEGYRLPTTVEWEIAARAGARDATYAGPLTAGDCSDRTLPAIAWFCGNSDDSLHDVGLLAPNDWGLFDVLGNAEEFVHDDDSFFPNNGDTDPYGDIGGAFHVTRGGAFREPGDSVWLSARQGRVISGGTNPEFGFRLVRSAPD